MEVEEVDGELDREREQIPQQRTESRVEREKRFGVEITQKKQGQAERQREKRDEEDERCPREAIKLRRAKCEPCRHQNQRKNNSNEGESRGREGGAFGGNQKERDQCDRALD